MRSTIKKFLLSLFLLPFLGSFAVFLFHYKTPLSMPNLPYQLYVKLPIPALQEKPGSHRRPHTSFFPFWEHFAISNKANKASILAIAFRWGQRFCLFDLNKKEILLSLDFLDFQALTIEESFSTPGGVIKPNVISWAPDDSKVLFSIWKEEEEKSYTITHKTYIYDLTNGKSTELPNLSGYNILNPWQPTEHMLILKKFHGTEKELNSPVSLAFLDYTQKMKLVKEIKPSHFQIIKDDIVWRSGQKIYIFKQCEEGKVEVWEVDMGSRKESLVINLKLSPRLIYSSRPLEGTDKFLVIGFEPSSNLQFPQTFLELREFPRGKLLRTLTFKHSYTAFAGWFPPLKVMALARFDLKTNDVILWSIEENKYGKISLGNKLTLQALSFTQSPPRVFIMARENNKELNFYIANIIGN
jgi:hypothetical protein